MTSFWLSENILTLLSGGPAGVIWGFLIVWAGTLSTFTVIAELASMYRVKWTALPGRRADSLSGPQQLAVNTSMTSSNLYLVPVKNELITNQLGGAACA